MARKYVRTKPFPDYMFCKTCHKKMRRRTNTGKCGVCFRKDGGWLKNLSESHKGYIMPEEQKRKIRLSCKGGNKTSWKKVPGSKRILRIDLRNVFKYRMWRFDVFSRDDYTCQLCHMRGGELHAHHIKYFSGLLKKNNINTIEEAESCDELWNVNNGITFCSDCHKKFHNKYGLRN